MAKITAWDDDVFKQRERDARERDIEADWQRAATQLEREASDGWRLFARCRGAACRRARRCVGDPRRCVAQSGWHIPDEIAQKLTEDIYAEIQQDKRFAATGTIDERVFERSGHRVA